MTQKSKRNLFGGNAASVVCDPHKRDTAVADFHGNCRCAGIHCVFYQLFYHGGRPLYDLAGRNFINRILIQYCYGSHVNPFCSQPNCLLLHAREAGDLLDSVKFSFTVVYFQRFFTFPWKRYSVFNASIGVIFEISSSESSLMISSSCTVSNSDICAISTSS